LADGLTLMAFTRVGCTKTPEDHIKTVEGTDAFTSFVLNSDHISVVKFYANWCGYSKTFRPRYDKRARELVIDHRKAKKGFTAQGSLKTFRQTK
jgi:hypothetical protein